MDILFKNQGRCEYERALTAKEKTLAKDRPSTFDTGYRMANVFDEKGQYEEALKGYERASLALGKDH